MSDLNARHNRVVWLDIPVSGLARAMKFYEGVLAVKVSKESINGFEFAVLAHDQGNAACSSPCPTRPAPNPA